MQGTATYELIHICDMTGAFQLAIHCNTLPINATLPAPCNTMQYTATRWNALQHTAARSNKLQHTRIHWNTLQHAATRCNTLQKTATHGFIHVRDMVYSCVTLQARSGWPSNFSSPFRFLLFFSISNKRDTAMFQAIASFPKTPFFPTNEKGNAQGFHWIRAELAGA